MLSLHPALWIGKLKVFGPLHTIDEETLWAMDSKPGFRLQRLMQEGDNI